MMQMNLSIKQRTDLWLAQGRRGGIGMDWEFGISRHKPFYVA